MKPDRTIALSAVDVEKIIHDLSLLIVSMDRIGSTFHNKPKRQATELDQYFLEVNAFKRLAKARAILDEAYSNQSSEADVLRSEEEGEALPYWQNKS